MVRLLLILACIAIAIAAIFQKLAPQSSLGEGREERGTDPRVTFKPWDGQCPYPNAIFKSDPQDGPKVQENLNALHQALADLQKRLWDERAGDIVVLQVYRPPKYTEHLREIWEWYRILSGLSPDDIRDYGCDNHAFVNRRLRHSLTPRQSGILSDEFLVHEFRENSFPVSCNSDHSRGIAVDFAGTKETFDILEQWALPHGLRRNIDGDDGHFILDLVR